MDFVSETIKIYPLLFVFWLAISAYALPLDKNK